MDKNKQEQYIGQSKNIFDKLLKQINQYILNKNYLYAVNWSQTLAHFAWNSNPGFFSNAELEELLLKVSRFTSNDNYNEKDIKRILMENGIDLNLIPKGKTRILHILSETFSIGGHTKVVERWLLNTDKTKYTNGVLITQQKESIPRTLRKVSYETDSWLINLGNQNITLIEKSNVIRKITKKYFDIVVLHVHPYDVLPVLVFGYDCNVPVLLYNHADHVFWLGSSIADLVVNFRKAGANLCHERRGINTTTILPLPLESKVQKDRHNSRKKLGFSKDDIILFSCANPYKYGFYKEVKFLQILKPLILKYPNVYLIIVGPDNKGEWQRANIDTNGRIQAVGLKKDLNLYYSAADIYIDSFPIPSLTATLDACLFGLPVVGLNIDNVPILKVDDISVAKFNVYKGNLIDFIRYLELLLNNSKLRTSVGGELREKVVGCHSGYIWKKKVDSVIEQGLNQKHYLHHFNTNNKIDENLLIPSNHQLSPIDSLRIAKDYHRKTLNTYEITSNKSLLFIWGTGQAGLKILRKLLNANISIRGFIDSDHNKWDKKVDGYNVFSPTDILNSLNKSNIFIFIGSMFEDEIVPLLEQYGYTSHIDYAMYFNSNFNVKSCLVKGKQIISINSE